MYDFNVAASSVAIVPVSGSLFKSLVSPCSPQPLFGNSVIRPFDPQPLKCTNSIFLAETHVYTKK